MGLSGVAYSASSRSGPTRDDEGDGRWVAVDESGWDGEQLYGRADRFLSIGSVAIDDEEAAEIVGKLRRDARVSQPAELKFSHFDGKELRLAALAALLGPGGTLATRASVYLVDKHYFVTAKIIDVFLEEEAHERGINFYEGGRARKAAQTLYLEGPRAMGDEAFGRLIEAMVGFCSGRNRDGSVVSADALFDEFQRVFALSHRRPVSDVLSELLRTRKHADSYPHDLLTVPELEPLIPCLQVIAHSWSERLGACSLIADEQRVFTDQVLRFLSTTASLDITASGPHAGVRRRPASRAVQSIVRGVSHDHPSIQLADLIAGSGQAVARRHGGRPSSSGDILHPAVVPLISTESMVPYDGPSLFSAIST